MHSRRVRPRTFVAAVVVVGHLFAVAPASAHLGHAVRSAERYLKVDVGRSGARLVVSLSLAATETVRVMQLADLDRDARVSEAERAQHLAAWSSALATELEVLVDDEPVPVTFQDAYFEPIGPITPAPMTIEIVGHFAVPSGRHVVSVRDEMVFGGRLERTDVAMRVRDDLRMIRCGVGTLADVAACDFVLAGTGRSVLKLEVDVPPAPEEWASHVAVGAGALLALVAVGVVARRQLARVRRKLRARTGS